mgnify:CR=1 FL=1
MILIIDDDSAVRSSLSFMLKRAGYEAQAVPGPREAMEVVRSVVPDLILMDMNFTLSTTGEEGLTLLKQVKIFRPETPVILMTAWGSIQLAVQGMQAGAFDFITKPFRPQELVIRVQHQLSLLRAERVIRRQNEKLKKSLEARDKLYSIIAHDLRAPIGTIKMINSSIEAQKVKIKDPQISKLFEMINETTEEAFNLLENLLRWTRNQNGKTKIYATLFNLTPVARQVVSLFSAIANAKEIELINRIEGKFDIFADEDMIKTVLRNLISNAIKFTYTGGQVELSLADSGDCWTIYVKDNGKGIPKDLQTHLLKSDEYITTYGTHNEKGSGLGLILCRDFIRMNKGKLHFCSQEGIGTTFYFTIPKASSSAKAASR